MKFKKYETTAKELAFKAYLDAIEGKDTRYEELDKEKLSHNKQMFELWWKKHYEEYFHKVHTVYIDYRCYILAE